MEHAPLQLFAEVEVEFFYRKSLKLWHRKGSSNLTQLRADYNSILLVSVNLIAHLVFIKNFGFRPKEKEQQQENHCVLSHVRKISLPTSDSTPKQEKVRISFWFCTCLPGPVLLKVVL